MRYKEYVSYRSEIAQLEEILSEIPDDRFIEKIGFESRLETARKAIEGIAPLPSPVYAKILFRGKPVIDTHAISASFATKATSKFTEVHSMIAASLSDNLRYMGPIPYKQKNDLLLTGIAVGSFGFEFEIPRLENESMLEELNFSELTMEKILQLFQLAADGSDDDIADLMTEIHPRVLKNSTDFLSYLSSQDAWFSLGFKQYTFRYESVTHLEQSIQRLKEDNIREFEKEFEGELQGILPGSRTFEFRLMDKQIIKGKVGSDIEDIDVFNRDFLYKAAKIHLHVVQYGTSKPRYSLRSVGDLVLA